MPEAMRHLDLPPPVTTVGLLGWIRQNLFSSPLQIFLTCVMIALLYTLLAPFVKWALVDANWSGESREDCTQAGACWVFIKVRLGQFIYGFYPRAERWRVDTTFVLLILASLPLFVPSFTKKSLGRCLSVHSLSVHSLHPACRGRAWLAVGRNAIVGWTDVNPGGGRYRDSHLSPHRYRSCAGKALGHAGGPRHLCRLHRSRPRGSTHNHPLHGVGHVPHVSSLRRKFRQASARPDRGLPVR